MIHVPFEQNEVLDGINFAQDAMELLYCFPRQKVSLPLTQYSYGYRNATEKKNITEIEAA